MSGKIRLSFRGGILILDSLLRAVNFIQVLGLLDLIFILKLRGLDENLLYVIKKPLSYKIILVRWGKRVVIWSP
jgi:hypothetical protein